MKDTYKNDFNETDIKNTDLMQENGIEFDPD